MSDPKRTNSNQSDWFRFKPISWFIQVSSLGMIYLVGSFRMALSHVRVHSFGWARLGSKFEVGSLGLARLVLSFPDDSF